MVGWTEKHRETFAAFARDERGVTAIEYALIGGFLVAALVAALPSITTALSGAFTRVAGYFPS